MAKRIRSVDGRCAPFPVVRAPHPCYLPLAMIHIQDLTYRVAGRGLDARQVERAVQLSKEKYCSATIMLGRTADVTARVEIIEGDRVPTPASG